MKRKVLRLTLLDDVALSERAASAGPHLGLDYIPGATLLGAAARRLYDSLSRDDAFLAFHSGKVRFGDGLPVASVPSANAGAVGLPVPYCWYGDKHQPWVDQTLGMIKRGAIWNRQFEGESDEPREQLRGKHVAPDGVVVEPERVLRMRTAINASTGMRREAALFGYQALSSGQDFVALLEADKDVPNDLFGKIESALTGNELRIGRSRRAELGRVRCAVENDAAAGALGPEPAPADENTDHLTFWLLSDLALEDETGSPILAPGLHQLVGPADYTGMPHAPLDWSGSFIRPTRYSPYNGYLRCHDVERVVLGRGSVLRYKMKPGEAVAFLKARPFESGFGLYREAGLGRVWCNPIPLDRQLPDVAEGRGVRVQIGKTPPPPPGDTYSSSLLAWLSGRDQAGRRTEQVEETAKQWLAELSGLYDTARDLAGRPDEPVGPQASQWGRVEDAACGANVTPAALVKTLFVGDNAICKEDDEAWEAEGRDGKDALISFRAWLQAKTAEEAAKPDLPRILARVANDARRLVQRVRREP